MKTKSMKSTVVIALIVAVLAAGLAAARYITDRNVIVGTKLYARDTATLDLRGRELSAESYEKLAWSLPTAEILWDVPFQGGRLSSLTEELTVTALSDADVAALAYFPQLKTVHAEQCTDYPQLLAAWQTYPAVEFLYSVSACGESFSADAAAITITSLTAEDRELLNYLPELCAVDASGCRDYEQLDALAEEHPSWRITRVDSIGGQRLDRSASQLEVSGASYAELSVGLAAMPNLKTLTLHDPEATGEELLRLREEYPDVTIHWDVTVFGSTYADDTEELDISNEPIGSIDEAKRIASLFPSLTKLIVDSGDISNEDMAAFREEMRPAYKVVWTIIFSSKCSSRTDAEYFMPTKQGEYYFLESYVEGLNYLEDVVALDLGHHPIKTTEFLKYMPKLKYLVLTYTQVLYITNIEYCKELLFLEVDWNYCRDLGNIQECTKLEDLSICDSAIDWEVVAQLTWLKHLCWSGQSTSKLIALQERLPDTEIFSSSYNPNGLRWRNLQNYYDSRDVLGMPYMN